MSLLSKKVKNLTPEEQESLDKSIGTSGIPYPGIRADSTGSDGSIAPDLGMIASDESPIPVISTRPHDQVVALAYSNMAAPSALKAEREILEQMRPSSSNVFTLILGKPGWGKTQLAENVAVMMDDRSPLFLNCSKRDLEELQWKTVIDPSTDRNTAIRDQVRNGQLYDASIGILEQELPEACIKDDDGNITDIDWNKMSKPRQIGTDDDSRPQYETYIEVVNRNEKALVAIAKSQGIPPQSSNVLGIKKVPGLIKEAWDHGLILIADEFTKGENIAPLLEFLNWASGMGPDACTIKSTMSINGRDETTEYTLHRSERRAGFRVIATGNFSDPMLYDEEASPAFSRMKTFRLKSPRQNDWDHRIGQILTGSPVSTHVQFFSEMAREDAEEFGELLAEWREGKAQAEGQETPLAQTIRLRNWEETRAATEQYARGFHFVERLLDLNSDLHKKNQYGDVRGEIRAGFSASNPIDPRIWAKQLVPNAEQTRAEVQKIDMNTGTAPRFNRSAVGKKTAVSKSKAHAFQAEFGTYLQREIEDWVAELTTGMPETQKAIVKEFRERGIGFTAEGQDNTAAQRLNQDMFAHMGGVKTIAALRAVLSKRMRAVNPALKGQSDDDIIPMDQAAALCEELTQISSNDNSNPYVGQVVTLGGDVAHAFNQAAAMESIEGAKHKPKKPKASQLVRTSDFLETLTVPTLANINMRSIWRRTLSNDNRVPAKYKPVAEIAEGAHESKVGITTIMTQNSKGEAVATHVMIDGERKKSLIVTDEIDGEVRTALGGEYTVVTYDDVDAESQVADFVSDTMQGWRRSQGDDATPEKLNMFKEALIGAFNIRAPQLQGGAKDASSVLSVDALAKAMTSKDTKNVMPVYMVNGLA